MKIIYLVVTYLKFGISLYIHPISPTEINRTFHLRVICLTNIMKALFKPDLMKKTKKQCTCVYIQLHVPVPPRPPAHPGEPRARPAEPHGGGCGGADGPGDAPAEDGHR